MKTSLTRFFSLAVTAVLLLAALGFTAAPVAANTSVQDDGGIVSSPPTLVVAAAHPWTKAQMLAAKPYPINAVSADSVTLSTELLAAPDGAAGSVAGKLPTKKAARGRLPSLLAGGPADLLGEVSPDGAKSAGYSYPAPFTRQYIDSISNSAWYPFSAVGKLFFSQNGVDYVCSASVIGYAGIVTAGHCVHAGNNRASGWSYNMVFVPSYFNGSAPYGQWYVANLSVESIWFKYGNPGGLRRDLGVGYITADSYGYRVGDYTGYLGYSWNQLRDSSWWLIGYPASGQFSGAYMVSCQSSHAYDSTAGSSGPLTVGVGCDMTGGTSGGPWVKGIGVGNLVNGVNSYRRNGYNKELFSPYFDAVDKAILDAARSYAP